MPRNRAAFWWQVLTIAALAAMAGAAHAAPRERDYATQGDCAGFPRVALSTLPGSCVGLVAARLGFLRGVTVVGDDVFVVDMGGWRDNHGRILRLRHGGRGQPEVLLSGLDKPNAIVPGPAGSLYAGVVGRIIRFDPDASAPASTVQDVLTGLPTDGRHPLVAFVVAADGSLFVNVGSKTDHCENTDGSKPEPGQACPETQGSPPRGTLLHVIPGAQAVDAQKLAPMASGLRNSMALALLPSGRLLAAANARDFINLADPGLADAELPHDPLILVEPGADYGWPYCFDDRRPSPEYPSYDCSRMHAPDYLLPAHAAPLGLLIYRGKSLAGQEGRLLIGFHGYRSNGHRLVSLGLTAEGKPAGELQQLVGDWGFVEGVHPQGSPVGLVEMADGSVLITEDHSGALLRLAAEH